MQARLANSDPLGGVNDQDFIEQILQLINLLSLVLGHAVVRRDVGIERTRHRYISQDRELLLLCYFVGFPVNEIAVLVEVLFFEDCPLDELVRRLAAKVHELLEHLVVGPAREHDLACVELIERDCN